MVQEKHDDSVATAIAWLLLGVAGYLIWDEMPDRWVIVGATIIIASGLFVVYREIGEVVSSRYLRASTANVDVATRQATTADVKR